MLIGKLRKRAGAADNGILCSHHGSCILQES
jgi:hypothetical protein